MSDTVLCDLKDGVATVTLNRPDARNALSMELRVALGEVLGRVELDPAVRAVVLRGRAGISWPGAT